MTRRTEQRPPIRVALLATHPIQYQIPWFCRLASLPELDFKVFFGMVPDATQQGVGFDVSFQWDIPLLEGYSWSQLESVSRKPGLGSFSGCNTPGVYRALRAWRPQAVILTGWHSLMMFQALWACIRLRVPIIMRGDSNALRPRPIIKRAGHCMLMSAFDYFLAVGKSNRRFYEQTGVPSDRIFDCPHFIDNDRFSSSALELFDHRAQLRARWQIPDRACCLLFAGKMIAVKRPLDLLRAVAKFRDCGAPIHILMVGTGELLDEAKVLAQRENLPVTFAGFLNQSEIAKAYVAADCLVLPSEGETWGLVVNEAMACGIPAIVSDHVGCGPDLVLEGQTGVVFPFGDIAALSEKIGALASEPAKLRAMGKAAQQRVMTYYSNNRAVEGTLAAIDAAVRR